MTVDINEFLRRHRVSEDKLAEALKKLADVAETLTYAGDTNAEATNQITELIMEKASLRESSEATNHQTTVDAYAAAMADPTEDLETKVNNLIESIPQAVEAQARICVLLLEAIQRELYRNYEPAAAAIVASLVGDLKMNEVGALELVARSMVQDAEDNPDDYKTRQGAVVN